MSEVTKAPRNRLANESSPYLQQHATNPVDWYPWGEEALQKARAEDKPIFLSIGYSACHWCHVMEHESFENEEIAAFMNEHFVNVKVDREERPDLDQIYMNAVVAMTGHGGWPMSVFLRPDLKPFFGGTYWPPTQRVNMPGFREILGHIRVAWHDRKDTVDKAAEDLTNAVAGMSLPEGEPQPLGEEVLQNAVSKFIRAADRINGGFGGAPKFPHSMDLQVLLRGWKRFGNQEALDVVTETLDKMAAGGIYDHLGGGFHRYSTDARWLVPHFEKMLYDNALLVQVYLEAYQAPGNEDYARVVRETLDYILREMTSPEGGFYSTQDADSEGEEGKFFVWTREEIEAVLPAELVPLFCAAYDVTANGNWEGKTILNQPQPIQQAAEEFEIDLGDLQTILAECKQQLFAVREQRIKPGRDEKVLASWNGLMITAMARAGAVLDEPKYVTAAENAAKFIRTQMIEDGRLLHAYKDGRARLNGYLEDYACLIDGLVELFQVNSDEALLTVAMRLADRLKTSFHDAEQGGFHFTSSDHEELIVRQKDSQDNATPAGNTMAATALLKLARLTGETELEDLAIGTLDMMSAQIAKIPLASGQALVALDFLLGPTEELVLAEGTDASENEQVLSALRKKFSPNQVFLRVPSGSNLASPALLADKVSVGDQVTLYRCQRGACQAPLVGVDAILSSISGERDA
ncbi:thioredoxin domain-containing protein [Calycomorphotria hydatis]|uniref:Spermatogenesis-associated protein 20-like TRX domain-containing protein n=1 Tax=Calycomorphotria hydatis TaxID=2528027 RepID=A0A517TDF0_9PLAN|nr:thioredoxin domain-containing protein [Calycomorphotria hydatis]QDT66391.1 hypothetical protein V22_36580 [Calycomorphotria hydatis]